MPIDIEEDIAELKQADRTLIENNIMIVDEMQYIKQGSRKWKRLNELRLDNIAWMRVVRRKRCNLIVLRAVLGGRCGHG